MTKEKSNGVLASETLMAETAKQSARERILMALPDNITKYRKAAGLTRAQLADKIGTTESAIGQYERGTRLPQIDILALIAQAFNVSIDMLVEQSYENFDVIKQYRLEEATQFFRNLGFYVIVKSDVVEIYEKNDDKPSFQFSNNRLRIDEPVSALKKFAELTSDEFVLLVENIKLGLNTAKNLKKIISGFFFSADILKESVFFPDLGVFINEQKNVSDNPF